MNWELIFKATAVATPSVIGLYQFVRLRLHSGLKNDLQLLKLYKEVRGEETRYSDLLKRRIDETIKRGYGDKEPLDAQASRFFILSIISTLCWLYIFFFHGMTPVLLILFIISIGLGIISFLRLRA